MAGSPALFSFVALVGLFLSLAAGPESAQGQVYQIRMTRTVCINGQYCRRTQGACSAVAIGRFNSGKELLITAAHCTRGTGTKVQVMAFNRWIDATILATETSGADISLIGITSSQPLSCAQVAATSPGVNERVTLIGYPGGGTQRRTPGLTLGTNYMGSYFEVNRPAIEGESGGAILNQQGQLAGVVSAKTGNQASPLFPIRYTGTIATDVLAIRRLCTKAWGQTPRCDTATAPPGQIQPIPEQRGPPIRLNPQPETPPENPTVTPPPTAPAPSVDEEARKEIERLKKLLEDEREKCKEVGEKNNDRIKDLQDRLDKLSIRDPIVTNPKPLTPPEPIPTVPEEPEPEPETENEADEESKQDWSLKNIPWGVILAAAAGAAGVGIPVWLLRGYRVVKVAKVARDRIHEYRENRTTETQDSPPDRERTPQGAPNYSADPERYPGVRHTEHHYTVDSPLRDRIRTETQIVPVETDSYRNAREQAKRHVVRRYPGSQEILETEDNLIGQFLAGQSHPPRG